MKKRFFVFISLIFIIGYIAKFSYAATIGNSLDLDVPERSAFLRQEVVEGTLDECEQAVKVKASFDMEFVFNKDLHTTNELKGAELKGQWFMGKLGLTLFNRVEPYVKIGTSDLEVKWKNGAQEIEVDADSGFVFGGGVKANIWEFENLGIRLTGDAQYRTTEPDVSAITVNGNSVIDKGPTFKVDEWQTSLLLSKKFEIPLKLQSIYVVPYTGVTYADSNVDVDFKDPNSPGTDYSLFDANNKKLYGFVLGLDIVPSLGSTFIYSLELRLVDEIALSLGATVKF
jgi:opacity protein-like surface antigen